jgi:hypothetical protein
MSPADTPDRDEDLADLLAELETTLTELRGELQVEGREAPGRSGNRESTDRADGRAASDRRRARDRRRDRSVLPRPPSVSELLRFTEQYTLPTLISTLEAAIQALELLRGTLRLVDGRSAARTAGAGRRPRGSATALRGSVGKRSRASNARSQSSKPRCRSRTSQTSGPATTSWVRLGRSRRRSPTASTRHRRGRSDGAARNGTGPTARETAPRIRVRTP